MATIKNVNINGTVSKLSAGVYDVSEQNGGKHYSGIEDVLHNADTDIPSVDRIPGMEIKFIEDYPAIYSVTKESNLSEIPENGTEIYEPLSLESGKYTSDELFDLTLPFSVGTSVIYYITVSETVEENVIMTYTSWTISYESASYSEYVQYRMMSSSLASGDFAATKNWQATFGLGRRTTPHSPTRQRPQPPSTAPTPTARS